MEYWVREMPRISLFPGPDLTCSSKDLRFLLLSHYKDIHIPTKSHQGGPTFHSPCLFDPKTLDPNTEVMRFWTLFHYSNIPLFHVDAIQEDYLKRLFISMSYTISETLILGSLTMISLMPSGCTGARGRLTNPLPKLSSPIGWQIIYGRNAFCLHNFWVPKPP